MTDYPQHQGTPRPDSLLTLRALLASGACLATALAVTAAVAAAILYPQHGTLAIAAAVVAAGICLGSGLLGLLATVWFQGTPHAVSGMLLGMLVRMAIPILAAIGLTLSGSQLLSAGVIGLIVVHYMVGLLIETMTALFICNSHRVPPTPTPQS